MPTSGCLKRLEDLSEHIDGCIDTLKYSSLKIDEKRLEKVLKISVKRYQDLEDYLALAQLYEYQNNTKKEVKTLKEIIKKFPEVLDEYTLTYEAQQLNPKQVLNKESRLVYENSSSLGYSKSKRLEQAIRDIITPKKEGLTPDAGYIVYLLITQENYKQLKELIQETNNKNIQHEQLDPTRILNLIIALQNNKESRLFKPETLFVRPTYFKSENLFQNYDLLAKKLGLKKITKTLTTEQLFDITQGINALEIPTALFLKQDKQLKKLNLEYQELLITILNLRPELKQKITTLEGLSENYDIPEVANIYNCYTRTGKIEQTIKKIKKVLKKGYNTNLSITLAQLYEKEGMSSKAKQAWEKTIEYILNDLGKNSEPIAACSSSNKVVKYVHNQKIPLNENSGITTLIFKLSSESKSLTKEKNAIVEFQKINLEKKLGINFPRILLNTNKDEYECIVMECEGTKKLIRPDLSNNYNLLKKVIQETAKIHVHFPIYLLDNVHTNNKKETEGYYSFKIKDKLFQNLNGFAKYHNRMLVRGYLPDKEKIKNEVKERIGREINLWNGLLGGVEKGNFNLPEYPHFILSHFGLEKVDLLKDYTKEEYGALLKKCFQKKITELVNSTEEKTQEEIVKKRKVLKDRLLEKRIRINKNLETIFFENYMPVLNIISQLKQGTYKDASLKNWCVDTQKDLNHEHFLIPIDYGTLTNSPYQFDVASVLETTAFPDKNVKKKLLKKYFDTFNEQTLTYRINIQGLGTFEEFEKGYYACALNKCLTDSGNYLRMCLRQNLNYKEHKKLYEDYLKLCNTLLENAILNVSELKKYFEGSTNYNKLERLGEQILEVKTTVNYVLN